MQFQPVSQPDQHPAQADDVTPEQSRMREIVALLYAQKLEMEQMRQSLIPPLTTAEIDKFLAEALPYAWMTTLAATLKETAMDDPTGQWSSGKLETATWRVINEELAAKRQGRQSAPTARTAHQQQPFPVATPYQGFVQQQTSPGSGTVCFSCGGRGHFARQCPMRAQAGQVQQLGGQTLWVSGNQAFELNGPPPAPCNRCGQMHWAQFPCLPVAPAAPAAPPPTAAPTGPTVGPAPRAPVDWNTILKWAQQSGAGPGSAGQDRGRGRGPHAPPPWVAAPRPPSVADGRAAYRDAIRAAARDMLSDTLSFAIRAYASGTRETYLCAARTTLRGMGDAVPLEVAIDARLLVLAGRRRGGSAARNAVSAFRMLEDLQLLGRVVLPRMWLQVRAIDKATAHLAAPRIWAAGADVERLGRCRHHWAWARTFFAVACAAVYALRVGDVARFSWDGIATPGWLTFWDQKVNAEWVDVPLSPFLEQWRAYIAHLRRPDHLPTGLLFPGGTSTASECLRQLVYDTPSAHITWHPWKRFSAAAYMWLGGTSYGLQLWARWRSPKQARHYARHPPSWTLPQTLCLPIPPHHSGSPARDIDWAVVAIREL